VGCCPTEAVFTTSTRKKEIDQELCVKCVEACRRAPGQNVLAFSRRGFDTILYVDPGAADAARCENCRACVEICPVGALVMSAG